jgi:stage IV sporulation protein FB
MTDPLTWSPINLGRWFGTQVRVHIFLIIFVVLQLLSSALARPDPAGSRPFTESVCWIMLLLGTLAVHELGHGLVAARLGYDRDEVRLWPLGNMVTPSVAARSTDHPLVIVAGPAVNLVVVIAVALGLGIFGHAQFRWSPFEGTGAPLVGGKYVPLSDPRWWIGWFGHLNWILFLANLVPALPFDVGRLVRGYAASAAITTTKDSMIGPWTAHTSAAILALGGLVRLLRGFWDGVFLFALALLIELVVRSEARMMEDGGFFEDGVFGYDFSEGYTSLEGSAAKVRPYRESALRRWRRRRSDLRRRRRLAREAAEEARMDEILDKLHREGRAALTDDETRFLVRVSTKYRNRPKTS